MAATPYKPVSFTSESVTQQKLQQMANNDQWLFENTPRLRYSVNELTRDGGIKMISGKTVYSQVDREYLDVFVYFGSFFTGGCKPIVTATVEHAGGGGRRLATIRGHGGEIDHRGFIAHVTTQADYPGAFRNFDSGGWLHWQAVGY